MLKKWEKLQCNEQGELFDFVSPWLFYMFCFKHPPFKLWDFWDGCRVVWLFFTVADADVRVFFFLFYIFWFKHPPFQLWDFWDGCRVVWLFLPWLMQMLGYFFFLFYMFCFKHPPFQLWDFWDGCLWNIRLCKLIIQVLHSFHHWAQRMCQGHRALIWLNCLLDKISSRN